MMGKNNCHTFHTERGVILMKKNAILSLSVLLLGLGTNVAFSQDTSLLEQPTTKLKVHAAPAPSPALRYRLLPELRDMETGNAALRYYRAFSPENLNSRDPKLNKALGKWLENPDKMPPELLRTSMGHGPFAEIALGARRTYCNWDMLRNLRKEGMGMLLPDIQGFRTYAWLLAAHARFQMAEGKSDEALHTLQTGFAFSRHVGDGPTLIQSLVGMAITHVMLQEVEHLVQEKDSPNLYWALTDLPRPFVDLRKPLQGERIMFDQIFPGLRSKAYEKNIKPMSRFELEAIVVQLRKVTQEFQLTIANRPWEQRLGIAVIAARIYPEGKRFLRKRGIPEKVVNKMPVTQVALFYEIIHNDIYYDEMAKWYGLPYPQMRAGVAKARKDFVAAKKETIAGTILAGLFMPATAKVFDAGYRLDRRIAALRCVEAIRLHAAEHGNLPASLDDIKEVPVPADPMTGRSFQYQLNGTTAILTAPPPPGQTVDSARSRKMTWTYEIMLQK